METIEEQEEKMHHQRVCADIDLLALLHNMKVMHDSLRPGGKMAAVIKTNAYGHGAVPIARDLEGLDYLWGYCVATIEEAEELRENGIEKPILILGYTFPDSYAALAREEIRPAVFRYDQLDQLDEAAEKAGKKIKIHIAVDTGMSRIGIRPDETGMDFVRSALDHPNLEVEGIFTHFAKADMPEAKAETKLQYEKFRDFTTRTEMELHYRFPMRHCDNSAGILTYPQYDMDMVRAGITMYGLWPSEEIRDAMPAADLWPVLSLHSHIVYVKEIREGEAVSYGGTFVAPKAMRVATIPVGYGDGYPRSLSNKGSVLIRGKRAPILGRVCMDQFMVDISGIPEAAEGDAVTLIGEDGEDRITCEELGTLSGRFNYELACDLNPRVPRVYSKEV